MQAPFSQRIALFATCAVFGGSLGVALFLFTHYPEGVAGWYSVAVGILAVALYMLGEYIFSE